MSILPLLPPDVQDAIARHEVALEFQRTCGITRTRFFPRRDGALWTMVDLPGGMRGGVPNSTIYRMHTTTAGGVMLWCGTQVVLDWPDFATAFAEHYDIARLRLRFEELLAALPSEDQLTESVTAAFDAQLWELYVQRHIASITPGVLQPVTRCANMGCACREQALYTAGPMVNELGIHAPDLQCGHPLVDMGYGIVDLAAEVILRRIEADRIRSFANSLRADSNVILSTLLPTE